MKNSCVPGEIRDYSASPSLHRPRFIADQLAACSCDSPTMTEKTPEQVVEERLTKATNSRALATALLPPNTSGRHKCIPRHPDCMTSSFSSDQQLDMLRVKIERKKADIETLNAAILDDTEVDNAEGEVTAAEENLNVKINDALYIIAHSKWQLLTRPTRPPRQAAARRQALLRMRLPITTFDCRNWSCQSSRSKYADWTSFNDLFEASVHNNNTLSNSQKLNYLKASLKADAEPQKLLASLTVTDPNYQVARQLLVDRYDNKRCIIRAHIHAICSYPAIRSENVTLLRKMQSAMMENIMALHAHGIKRENDAYTVYLIAEKLDPESRKQWELSSTGSEPQKLNRAAEIHRLPSTSAGSKSSTAYSKS